MWRCADPLSPGSTLEVPLGELKPVSANGCDGTLGCGCRVNTIRTSLGTKLFYTSSCLVALGTSCTRRMEEQERIVGQVFECNLHDVPGACEPCVSVSHAAFGLEATCPQPLIREGEARATNRGV